MKQRKVRSIFAMVLAGTMILAGCGGSGGTSADSGTGTEKSDDAGTENNSGDTEKTGGSGEKTVINFYYWDEGQKEGMDELISMFEESQDEVVVESTIVPWGDLLRLV